VAKGFPAAGCCVVLENVLKDPVDEAGNQNHMLPGQLHLEALQTGDIVVSGKLVIGDGQAESQEKTEHQGLLKIREYPSSPPVHSTPIVGILKSFEHRLLFGVIQADLQGIKAAE
jgi:hypothetical protein